MIASAARRAVPWGVLGMLVVVAGVEQFIARHDLMFCQTDAAAAKWTARASREQARDAQLLLLGDSLVKTGVQPRILEQQLGRTALNLAIVGGPPPATLVLLQHALRAGARPAAVVVDFKANIIAQHPRVLMRRWPEMFDARELAVLAWRCRDVSFGSCLFLSKIFPSLRARDEVRLALLAALSATDLPGPVNTVTFWRNENVNKGAVALPASAGEKSFHVVDLVYYPASWYPDRTNVRYMREFFQLTRSRQIPVFWLLPPIQASVQQRREEMGLHARYLALVRYMQRLFPELIVVDGHRAEYLDAAFHDASHLNRDGAATFSAGVAAVLSDFLARGSHEPYQWVGLPRYQPLPGRPPLEDLLESRLAVAAGMTARK